MAIEWYFALAQVLTRAGIDIDDVFDLVNAWLAGERPVWLRPADDRATGTRYVVLWARTGEGRPLAVLARVMGPDLYICGANYLRPEQVTEFEKWEATRND
ncbi:hypothetical protein [Nocardia sp. NBC_01327]|uniref:hypothetical protein n=1 Tax=Nocardia sp. NBC_01327 TaxID=2903593 RepID=UPI002E0D5849|nr:hypothetical protein OG326_35395 [Nocardia sp. NBC_01327]